MDDVTKRTKKSNRAQRVGKAARAPLLTASSSRRTTKPVSSAVASSASVNTATRINARLDAPTAQKLEAILKKTGYTVTDAVKAAIEGLYKSAVPETRRPTPTLDSLVGRFSSKPGTPRDLSANYKKYVGQALDEKFSRMQGQA